MQSLVGLPLIELHYLFKHIEVQAFVHVQRLSHLCVVLTIICLHKLFLPLDSRGISEGVLQDARGMSAALLGSVQAK